MALLTKAKGSALRGGKGKGLLLKGLEGPMSQENFRWSKKE